MCFMSIDIATDSLALEKELWHNPLHCVLPCMTRPQGGRENTMNTQKTLTLSAIIFSILSTGCASMPKRGPEISPARRVVRQASVVQEVPRLSVPRFKTISCTYKVVHRWWKGSTVRVKRTCRVLRTFNGAKTVQAVREDFPATCGGKRPRYHRSRRVRRWRWKRWGKRCVRAHRRRIRKCQKRYTNPDLAGNCVFD